MATYSSILACKIPWIEEPGGLQSMGWTEVAELDVTEHVHIYVFYLGELFIMDELTKQNSWGMVLFLTVEPESASEPGPAGYILPAPNKALWHHPAGHSQVDIACLPGSTPG